MEMRGNHSGDLQLYVLLHKKQTRKSAVFETPSVKCSRVFEMVSSVQVWNECNSEFRPEVNIRSSSPGAVAGEASENICESSRITPHVDLI